MPAIEQSAPPPITSATRPWMIWGLVVLFYFYDNMLQVSPGVMTNELMRDLHVDGFALGNLAAFFFYAYAPTQIPVGMLLDRYGPRLLVTLATLTCVIGAYVFSSAGSVYTAQIGRLLIGFGSAFAAVSCMKLAATWFPLERFSFLTGLMVTAGLTGSIVGEKPLALLVQSHGWRFTIFCFVISGIVIALLVWCLVRDAPKHMAKPADIEEYSTAKHMIRGLKLVVKQPQSWIVAIYGGLMFAPTSIFGALWGVPFLMQTHHISAPDAAGINIMLYAGWAVGSPLSGIVSDRLKKRKPTLYFASLGSLVAITLVIYIPTLSMSTISVLLFLFGFFSSGFLPSFSIMREISITSVTATALGFMNMFNMIGGALGQPLVGKLLDRGWDGSMIDGARIYSVSNFHSAMAILPVMIAVSLFMLPLVKETNCRSIEDEQWYAGAHSLK